MVEPKPCGCHGSPPRGAAVPDRGPAYDHPRPMTRRDHNPWSMPSHREAALWAAAGAVVVIVVIALLIARG